MTLKEQVKKATEMKINELKQALELLDCLPDGPFDFLINISIYRNRVVVRIPYDATTYAKYRRAMGRGWRRRGEWVITMYSDSISRHCSYWPAGRQEFDGGPVLRLALDTELAGSTCWVEQIGVEEHPVLKLVCD